MNHQYSRDMPAFGAALRDVRFFRSTGEAGMFYVVRAPRVAVTSIWRNQPAAVSVELLTTTQPDMVKPEPERPGHPKRDEYFFVAERMAARDRLGVYVLASIALWGWGEGRDISDADMIPASIVRQVMRAYEGVTPGGPPVTNAARIVERILGAWRSERRGGINPFREGGSAGNVHARSYSRFQKGTGLYSCRLCGKRTRDVGDDSAGVQLCAACYAQCGAENAAADSETKGEADAKK